MQYAVVSQPALQIGPAGEGQGCADEIAQLERTTIIADIQAEATRLAVTG